jgi:hypothetical protein
MSEFKWAHSEGANLTEPIEALKEHGWQYADVPTAANFNWLFHEISGTLHEISRKLREMSAELKDVPARITELSAQAMELQQKTWQLQDTLVQVKAASDQNAIDSGHYRRAIRACIHSLNTGPGERHGLDTGVHIEYPFEEKRRRHNNGGSGA